MLALSFHIGKDRFALPCADVVEVVPRVQLREIPHAPPHVIGIFTYRGAIVPVVDLCRLMWRTPCPDRLSSRIMLVRTGDRKLLGLLAERVTEAIALEAGAAAPPTIAVADTPYLGEIFFEGGSMVQLVHVESLVPDAQRALEAPRP
jgi:chemotaxis-related protein WspB